MSKIIIKLTTVFVIWLSLGLSGSARENKANPRDPVAEAATFRLADSALTIELVASEPSVTSPVAIDWDETGRMFVAEMNDYPEGERSGSPTGRIRVLEDRDGDGFYEQSTVFADQLRFPSSVTPWKGGIFVTAAPDIWYFKDLNGDGKADERRVMFTGFGEGNPQLRVNGLFWGVDNWIYGANGRSDGAIRRSDEAENKAISIDRRDFRWNPRTNAFETTAGQSQFGAARDDWGDRFLSLNTYPIRHVVIEERVLARNPYLARADSVASILDPADDLRVFPIGPPRTRFNAESVETFNASCGPLIYRGSALPDEYRGDVFVCEPLTNLIHRRKLIPDGASFKARRVERDKEFLASTDSSFSPVNLANGPDGALYVVDFYRELVEHPQFVPEELRKSVDFRRWNDRGRIWRIRRKSDRFQSKNSQSQANKYRGIDELIADFEHPDGRRRDTAQRLLVERGDNAAIAPLEKTAVESKNPLARIHALWTLSGLNSVKDEILIKSLRDRHPRVREAAVRLAAGRTELSREIASLADDTDLRVRFQTAIALGGVSERFAIDSSARIAERDIGDEWSRLAILSGLGETVWVFLQTVLERNPEWLSAPTEDQNRFLEQAAEILGARRKEVEVRELIESITLRDQVHADPGKITLLAGLTEGLARSGLSGRSIREMIESTTIKKKDNYQSFIDRVRTAADSDQTGDEERERAFYVICRLRPAEASRLVCTMLRPESPERLRNAAVRAIGLIDSNSLSDQVLNDWGRMTIDVRRKVAAEMASSPNLALRLVYAMEQNKLGAADLDPSTRDVLRRLGDAALRGRVEALLKKFTPANRSEVLNAYRPALSRKGDARRGGEIFEKNCRICHRRKGIGASVGPDLSGTSVKPAETLLSDILDPNHDVNSDFLAYRLETKQGRIVTGVIAEETASSVKIRSAGGVEETVLRSEIDELRSTGASLMPEGLERTLDQQDVADLLEYLRRQ